MNTPLKQDLLEYKRDRALNWLKNTVQEKIEVNSLDQEIDALVRKVAGLEPGNLYGFVRVPEQYLTQEDVLKPNQIMATHETFIKLKPIASNYLTTEEKHQIPVGTTVEVESSYHDKHQHLCITLPNGRQGYIYGPHWELPKVVKDKDVKLDVPYFYQRDNWTKYHGPGGRQCNLTAHCMAAEYLLKGEIGRRSKTKGYHEPEDYYGEILAAYGDTTDPQAHTPTYRDLGLTSYFTYTASIKDLIRCLDQGVPVPMGVAYKASGHYVCAVGHRADGVYIHDPFGIRMGLTDNYDPSPGKYDFVTWDWLQAKWVDQGSEAGWMRVVTDVNGTPTGIPGGL